MTQIYLYETLAAPDAATMVPVRLSTGTGYNHPSGPGQFNPAILPGTGGLTVQRNVFDGFAFGAGDIQFGTIEVANLAGQLDALLDYGFGRTATLRLGDEDGSYGDFVLLVTGRATQILAGENSLAIGWESRLRELDEPVSPATFAGTNSGVTGLEGTPDTIAGRRKPRAGGRLTQISPVLLNSSTRVFGWNYAKNGSRAPSHSVDAVRFRGSEWTFDADYPNAAALLASTPIQGHYTTCLAESLVLMGGSNALSGPVTFDVTIEATAAERYASNLLKDLLLDAGVALADINAGDLATLAADAPYEAGWYANGDVTYRTLCNGLAASIAAVYLPDRLGRYRLRQLIAPEDGVPSMRFVRLDGSVAARRSDADLIACAPETGASWVPAKEMRVRYAPHWTVLRDTDVADIVTGADRDYLLNEWRTTDPATAPTIAAKYANAEVRTFDTWLCDRADAEALRDRLLAFFGAMRRPYSATVSVRRDQATLYELGDVVTLEQPVQGMQGGKPFLLLGQRIDDNTNTAEIRVLG